MSIRLDRPAQNLDEVYLTLTPEPLQSLQDFEHFYSMAMNDARNGDRIAPMVHGLNKSFGATFYKSFFIGHSGVGKSTEVNRLANKLTDKFCVLRVEAPTDLNAVSFQASDVPLVMMIKLTEAVQRMLEAGQLQGSLDENLLTDILAWFNTEKSTVTTKKDTGLSAEAGIKPSPLSDTVGALLGLFVQIKGEIKYSTARQKEVVEYRINSLATLIDLLNRLLDQASILLKESQNQEWLFIGEDFDKPGIPIDRIEALFVNNASMFLSLRTHLIFNIPVALAYSGHQRALPCRHIPIYDAPVYDKDCKVNEKGRGALQSVLEARLQPELFAEGQAIRFVVASGGNLRDLFEMVLSAADNAALRPDTTRRIEAQDAIRAISEKRRDYRNRLGTGPYEPKPIPYEDKAKRLVEIYKREPGHDVPDDVLLSLLRASVVQEFNGEGWFGVHPLVVDILVEHGKIEKPKRGSVPGGSI